MTGPEALRRGIAVLRGAGMEDAARDARLLLAHATGVAPDRLTVDLPASLTAAQARRFTAYLAARARHQPVSQITGRRLFWGRSFRVTQDVLDPRPETETLVAAALELPFTRVLDLGTGSGAILLSLLSDRADASGVGTDISASALGVARGNARRLGLSGRARFSRSDWFEGVRGRFDLIVSNPPYITAQEMAALAPDVRDWEPLIALTPGGDGLDACRAIAAGCLAALHPGGHLLLEIGQAQAAAVTAILHQHGLRDVGVRQDMDGRDRVVTARAGG